MQTVNAIMLILGCAHDVQLCEPTELDQPYYASIEQCESDIPAQQHFADGFPLSIVKCLEVEKLAANEAARIQWHFTKQGVLIAHATPFDGSQPLQPNKDILVASTNEVQQQ